MQHNRRRLFTFRANYQQPLAKCVAKISLGGSWKEPGIGTSKWARQDGPVLRLRLERAPARKQSWPEPKTSLGAPRALQFFCKKSPPGDASSCRANARGQKKSVLGFDSDASRQQLSTRSRPWDTMSRVIPNLNPCRCSLMMQHDER